MTLMARTNSKPRLTKDAMMQAEKTHFAMSRSTAGLIWEDQLSKASRLTATKVSTP